VFRVSVLQPVFLSPVSRSQAEPRGEERRAGEGALLLLLLAGTPLHRQREGHVGADDGGAGRGAGGAGTEGGAWGVGMEGAQVRRGGGVGTEGGARGVDMTNAGTEGRGQFFVVDE